MNIMADQPGAPFYFSTDGDDNMEISSPRVFHDQDIDIDLELGDGEEVVGEDENMLEDAPSSEFLGATETVQPAVVDDEMADDIPTPKNDGHASFAFGAADFNPEVNDLDLIDDGEDYTFESYQEMEPSREVEFMTGHEEEENIIQGQREQESVFPGHQPASRADDPNESQPGYGEVSPSDHKSDHASAGLEHAENVDLAQVSNFKQSQDQATIQNSEGEEQRSIVPASQGSLDQTEAPTPQIAKDQRLTDQASLQNNPGQFVHSDNQGTEKSIDDTVHQESHSDSEEGHYQSEVGLDNDGTNEHPQTVQPLHPVVVKYLNEEMSLFQCKESEVERSPTFFLQDQALASQSILELLASCRDVLAGSVDDLEELNLRVDVLGLDFCETTPESSTTSLAEVLDIYLQLCFNDGIDFPEPLVTTLSTKPRLAQRLELLRTTASDGGSLSAIAYTSNEDEYAYDDETEKQQNVQDKIDQPLRNHDYADAKAQAANANVIEKISEHDKLTEEFRSQTQVKSENQLGQESSVVGASKARVQGLETGGATQAIPTKGSPTLQEVERQSSPSSKPAELGNNSILNEEVDFTNQQLDEPNLDNESGLHGSDDGSDLGLSNFEDGDAEQDFELDFDQTTAVTEVPSDPTPHASQGTNTKGPSVDNAQNVAPQDSFERPGSSSGSSTVKGDTAAVDTFATAESAEDNPREPKAGVATHGDKGSDLGAVADSGLLDNNGEEDELTWDEDEDLPPPPYHQTSNASPEEFATNVQNGESLKGLNDSSVETLAPKDGINAASTTQDTNYDSDEITYDDEELDAPILAIEQVPSPKANESLQGSPTSIKRGRTSNEELDHDQLEGQGQAKRVKSM